MFFKVLISLSTFPFSQDEYLPVVCNPHWYSLTNTLQNSLDLANFLPKFVLILTTCLPICFNYSSTKLTVANGGRFSGVQNIHIFLTFASTTTIADVNCGIYVSSKKQNPCEEALLTKDYLYSWSLLFEDLLYSLSIILHICIFRYYISLIFFLISPILCLVLPSYPPSHLMREPIFDELLCYPMLHFCRMHDL